VRLFVYEFVSAGGLGASAPESLRCEGEAMLQAIADDFAQLPDVQVTTVDERTLREGAADADATLIIAPEFNDILAERSQWVLDAGGRLLGSFPAGIALAADKLVMHDHWRQRGIQTPQTIPATVSPPTVFGPAWVLKPRYGAGAQATFRVRNAAEWRQTFALAHVECPQGGLIAQPFVPGLAASVSFLIGPLRCAALMPVVQRLSTEGRFLYLGGRLPMTDLLSMRAVRLASAALVGIEGLQGYVGVDLVLGAAEDGSEDYVIEINPRLTTSYIGLRRLCRDNLARAWLDAVNGHAVEFAWREGAVEFSADGTVRE
jgi:predicted ATP-grasp superfamily ATP-dependent carboligase